MSRSCSRLTRAANQGNPDEIRSAAEELAAIAERDEDWAHFARGCAYLEEPSRAVEPLEAAVSKDPTNFSLLHALAKTYGHLERNLDALVAIDSALAVNSGISYAWVSKGRILERLRKLDDALVCYERAVRLDSGDADAACGAASVLLDLGRFGEAVDLLAPFARRRVPATQVLGLTGMALFSAGNVRRALNLFERACRLYPKDGRFFIDLANWYLSIGDRQNAIASIRSAIILGSPRDNWQTKAGRVLFALELYADALEMLPSDVVAHLIYHDLDDAIVRMGSPEDLGSQLRRIAARLPTKAWGDAFRGGLLEYVSHTSKHTAKVLRSFARALESMLDVRPEVADTLKFVETMGRYKETGDERVLLELPLEQRIMTRSD